ASSDGVRTVCLSVHAVAPPPDGPAFRAVARPVRVGGNLIVVSAEVFHGVALGGATPSRPSSLATITLLRVARPGRGDGSSGLPFDFRRSAGSSHSAQSFANRLGIEVVDAGKGVAKLEKSDYVSNIEGSVHGGVFGALFIEAAEALMQSASLRASAIHID